MRVFRWLFLGAIAVLIMLGADLAFDRRFVPLAGFWNRPLYAILIYAPTAVFATVALIQVFRRRLWPAAAFSAGLIGTGVFHQWVASQSYNNPGYMFPTGHLAAPVVSVVAYSTSFLVAWLVIKVFRYSWESLGTGPGAKSN